MCLPDWASTAPFSAGSPLYATTSCVAEPGWKPDGVNAETKLAAASAIIDVYSILVIKRLARG